MYYFILAIMAGIMLWAAVRQGPAAALRWALAAGLMLPTWMSRDMGAVKIDLRMAVSLVAIGIVMLHPRTRLGGRLVLADLLVVLMAAVQVTSECLSADVKLTEMIGIVVQWLVPYCLGRLALLGDDSPRQIVPLAAIACAVLALWSAMESLTHVNPVGLIANHAGSIQGQSDLRWGLRRAEGPMVHPIYFGIGLVMVLPWAMAAAAEVKRGDGPRWWRAAPWLVAAGIFFTMSRGPQLAAVLTLLVMAWFRKPRLRPVLLATAACGLAGVVTFHGFLLDLLQSWSQESWRQVIVVNGELVEYNGTMHRLLQLRVYADAVSHAGWFGYGSAPLLAGTTTVPYVEDHLRTMFSSIDNHYLQFVLQTGHLGLGLFVALSACGLAYLARVALRREDPQAVLAAALFGAIVAVLGSLVTVYFATDISFLFVASLGMAAARRAAELSAGSHQRAAAVAISPFGLRRLAPGHPL